MLKLKKSKAIFISELTANLFVAARVGPLSSQLAKVEHVYGLIDFLHFKDAVPHGYWHFETLYTLTTQPGTRLLHRTKKFVEYGMMRWKPCGRKESRLL